MNPRIHIYTMIAGVTLFLTACRHVSQSIKDTFNTLPEEQLVSSGANEGITGFVADEQALIQAEQILRALPQYGGHPIYLYGDIHFYDDGRINAKLQHPENPEYIDAYSYENGRWNGPSPVQRSVSDDLRGKLVALDSVPFRTVATIVRNYNEKAGTVIGANPTDHVYLIIRYGTTQWYPNHIDGTRELWQIYFHRDGSVASFNRK
ncbi:hypothetical protein [Parapedobacter sp.]